ncbi:hypothetical protein BRC93_14990 [Halobacteriales archaeon QS_5_70_15]|nr:MAG: hypothetical protein BRC93_14990 [Halobacteriales archaeon QS_5_70_15]
MASDWSRVRERVAEHTDEVRSRLRAEWGTGRTVEPFEYGPRHHDPRELPGTVQRQLELMAGIASVVTFYTRSRSLSSSVTGRAGRWKSSAKARTTRGRPVRPGCSTPRPSPKPGERAGRSGDCSRERSRTDTRGRNDAPMIVRRDRRSPVPDHDRASERSRCPVPPGPVVPAERVGGFRRGPVRSGR